MNTSIHIAFPIFFPFHACCIWHFIYLYNMTPMHSHINHEDYIELCTKIIYGGVVSFNGDIFKHFGKGS